MAAEHLFDIEAADPDREHQACGDCLIGAWASDDALRVRGWLVYDGTSLTGQPLHVRTCPACQREGAKKLARRPARRAARRPLPAAGPASGTPRPPASPRQG